MTKQEKQEFIEHIITIYDEYLQLTENRGISYGEIAYIQGLKKKELLALNDEIEINLIDNSKEYYDLKFN